MLLLFVLLLVPASIQSAVITRSLSFAWTYTTTDEADITGFEICQFSPPALIGAAPAVINDIPKTARFATGSITYDNARPQRFFIRAIDDTDPAAIEKSDPSNVIKLIVTPGQFKRN